MRESRPPDCNESGLKPLIAKEADENDLAELAGLVFWEVEPKRRLAVAWAEDAMIAIAIATGRGTARQRR